MRWTVCCTSLGEGCFLCCGLAALVPVVVVLGGRLPRLSP
jgi:hypothetical protein